MKLRQIARPSAVLVIAYSTAVDASVAEFLETLAPFKLPLAELSAGLVGRPVSLALFDTVPPPDAALSACHHRELESANIASARDNISPCDNARYLASLQALSQQVQDNMGGMVESVAAIDFSAMAYSQVFVDFIEARKPVEFLPPNFSSSTDVNWVGLWTTNASESERALRALDICINTHVELRSKLVVLEGAPLAVLCPDVLSNLLVPEMVQNDYLVQLTEATLLGQTSTPQDSQQSNFTHPPTVLSLPEGKDTDFSEACSLGMNAIIEVISGQLDVAVYDTASDAGSLQRYLNPSYGTSASSLHRFTYAPSVGWSPFDDQSASPTKTLGTNSRFFVPPSAIISLRGSGGGGGTALKYCFVDASNLNSVKEQARLEAYVHPETRALLEALSSFHLDTSMSRSPAQGAMQNAVVAFTCLLSTIAPELKWSDHTQWPRPLPADTAGGGDMKKGSRRRSQKDWQAETKWKWRIVALTLPTLEAPTVANYGRGNATLNWLSSFEAQEGDSTDFGYTLSWYQGHSKDPAGSVELKHSTLAKSFASDDHHVHDLSHTLPEGTLLPNTSYVFRVNLFYGEAVAPTSAASKPIMTPSLSPPSRMHTAPVLVQSAMGVNVESMAQLTTVLTLAAPPPLDDGGSKLLGYIVEGRLVGAQMLDSWVVFGSHPERRDDRGHVVITVDHLSPGCSYEFRLTAYNAIGTASLPGAPSQPFSTGELSGAHGADGRHVHGHGSKTIVTHHADGDSAAGIRAHLLSLHDPHVFSTHGPVVTLDDHAQIVRHSPRAPDGAQSDRLAVGVWAAHWSPKRWLTSAELIVADPPLLDGPLNNARAVRQRIVLAERGGVPLVDKVLRAQSAGALGVIITDTGDCTMFDQNCSPGAEKKNGDGFAKLDLKGPWKRVRVPVVMMLRDDADRFLDLFD